MRNYFDHNAKQGNRKEVSLDVVEFEPVSVMDGIIQVQEHIDDTAEFRKMFESLMEQLR